MKLEDFSKDEREAWARNALTIAVRDRVRERMAGHEHDIAVASGNESIDVLRGMNGKREAFAELFDLLEDP